MKNYEFKNKSGYSIWIEAEHQKKAKEIYNRLYSKLKITEPLIETK